MLKLDDTLIRRSDLRWVVQIPAGTLGLKSVEGLDALLPEELSYLVGHWVQRFRPILFYEAKAKKKKMTAGVPLLLPPTLDAPRPILEGDHGYLFIRQDGAPLVNVYYNFTAMVGVCLLRVFRLSTNITLGV